MKKAIEKPVDRIMQNKKGKIADRSKGNGVCWWLTDSTGKYQHRKEKTLKGVRRSQVMTIHQHGGSSPGAGDSFFLSVFFWPTKPLRHFCRMVSTLKLKLVAFGNDSQQLIYTTNLCISCLQSLSAHSSLAPSSSFEPEQSDRREGCRGAKWNLEISPWKLAHH